MKLLTFFFVFFASVTIYGFHKLWKSQNVPYMDEIFHIPQARSYCEGNFSHWDPKITTLPGLYLVTVGLYKPMSAVMQVPIEDTCSTVWLRAINVLFTFGNFYLIFALLKKLHNPLLDEEGIKLSMTTLALSLFPVLYFFTFLYYTDPGSTFFVLLMYLFFLHGNQAVAAVMGLAGIMFRQTNIIWVLFVAGLAVRKELTVWLTEELAKKKEKKITDVGDMELLVFTFKIIWQGFRQRRAGFRNFIVTVVKHVWLYALVVVGFAVFVIVNNGIVVGDRTAHSAGLNVPQIFYFFSLTNFFAMFHLCTPYKIWDFMKFCWKRWALVIAFLVISAAAVHFLTYEHKYLLSDNRHYTFYIWSKIYRRHKYVKFILIPAYLYFTWSFFSGLKDRDIFWKIIYCLAVVMSTVPQHLLEFRYFIVPYLIFRMNMRYGTALALLHEILLNVAVNIVSVYLFTEKPFTWAHEESLQRFMW